MDLDSFFALKSLRERLKRDFDDSKLIFFRLQRKFQVSHFKTLFRSFRQLERRKHDIRHCKIRNFGLVAAFQVLNLALKTSFQAPKRCPYGLRQLFCAQIASRTLKRDFDDSQLIFFFTCKESFRFLIFNTLFRSFRQLERRKHDIRHGKIRKFGLVAAFQVLNLALKTSFQAPKRCPYGLRQLFCAQIASRTLKTRF